MFLLPFSELVGVDFVDLFSSLVFLDYMSPFNYISPYLSHLFVVKLVWWYWILLTFACLKSFLFLHKFWKRSLLGSWLQPIILVVDFFHFGTLNISCHSLLACRVSAERSAVKSMGFPFYVTCCFSLAAFNILSLCLVFISLISMCCGMFLFRLFCMGLFVPLGVDWLFPFPCWGNFQL